MTVVPYLPAIRREVIAGRNINLVLDFCLEWLNTFFSSLVISSSGDLLLTKGSLKINLKGNGKRSPLRKCANSFDIQDVP
jgi:hypothetical protein